MLTTLTYASFAHHSVTYNEVIEILNVARDFNSANGITGMLCYGNDRFMQCIEGERNIINDLYNKILRDKRHTGIILLDYKEIEKREFGNWSMGYISAEDKQAEKIIHQVSFRSIFMPELLGAVQSANLISKLKKNLAPQVDVKINLSDSNS